VTLFLKTKSSDQPDDERTAPPPPSRPWFGTAAVRRWGRRHLRRENIVDAIKTAAWVIPLTVLIWFYAEQEQAYSEPRVQALVALKSPDPNRIVTLANPNDESILVSLSGRRAKVEAVKAELAKNTPEGRVPIVVPTGYSTGEHQLATQQLVQDAPVFVNNGVTVVSVSPMTIGVVVDTYTDIQVPVQVPPEANNIGSAVFEPPNVRVFGPKEVLKAAVKNGQAVAYADFSKIPELTRAGPHEPVQVPVTTPVTKNEHVTISPGTVMATVTVQSSTISRQWPSMPIWVEGAEGVRNDFKVEGDLIVKDVTLIGPPDKIQEIVNQTYVPHATLQLTREDAQAGQIRQRKLWFDNGSLPPGVTVSKADQDRTYDFRVVPRNPNP
jgi:hypothetical protein